MMNVMRKWLDLATAEQKAALAAALHMKDSVYLQHLASGRRRASGKMAGAIRLAAKRFKKLPRLRQQDLSDDCSGCEYAKRCEK
jgi:hypothetical protein